MVKKYLRYFIAVIALIAVFFSLSAIIFAEKNTADIPYDMDELSKTMSQYNPGIEPVIVEDGQLEFTENFDVLMEAYLSTDEYTPETARKEIILSALLRDEAEKEGIVVPEEEVTEFIREQKENLDHFEQDEIETYFDNLDLTKDEFYDLYYHEYEDILYIQKLRGKKYEEFIDEKLKEKLDEMGITPDEQEYAALLEHELKTYDPDTTDAFEEYFKEYKTALLQSVGE